MISALKSCFFFTNVGTYLLNRIFFKNISKVNNSRLIAIIITIYVSLLLPKYLFLILATFSTVDVSFPNGKTNLHHIFSSVNAMLSYGMTVSPQKDATSFYFFVWRQGVSSTNSGCSILVYVYKDQIS